jgi:hypothetical protein
MAYLEAPGLADNCQLIFPQQLSDVTTGLIRCVHARQNNCTILNNRATKLELVVTVPQFVGQAVWSCAASAAATAIAARTAGLLVYGACPAVVRCKDLQLVHRQ